MDLLRPAWVEIDLDAVTNNIRELKRILRPDVTIIGAIKAHGYGHGLVPMARHLLSLGIPLLGVGDVYEGIRLRQAGIEAPIQVFGNTLPEAAGAYVEHNLMPTFFDPGDPDAYMAIVGPETPLNVWV